MKKDERTFDQFRTEENLVVAIQTVDGQIHIGQEGDIHAMLANRLNLFERIESCGFYLDGQYWEEHELIQTLNLN